MSLFQTQKFPCPNCEQGVEFSIVHSVNADRRPDFREAILSGTFQRGTCGACGAVFRVEPQMTYLDVDRKQWLLVHPAGDVGDWEALEDAAQVIFDRAFGLKADEIAQQIGKSLDVRVTFGWSGLREKIVCAEHGLDDVVVELLKAATLSAIGDSPLQDGVELRLVQVSDDELTLAWQVARSETPIEALRLPRSAYEEIRTNPEPWQPLREILGAGPFVDLHRALVTAGG